MIRIFLKKSTVKKKFSPLFHSFTTIENNVLAKPLNQTCNRIASTLILSLKYTVCTLFSLQWKERPLTMTVPSQIN